MPPTPQNHAPVHTRTQIQEIAVCALQVLLDCLLAALGASLEAFWTPFGASWVPLGLNLGSLGRLWDSSWGLVGASWAPLGPLGRSWTNLGPSGRQKSSKWTQIARQVSAKLGARMPVASYSLSPSKTAANSKRVSCSTVLLSPDGDICNTSICILVRGAAAPPGPPSGIYVLVYS